MLNNYLFTSRTLIITHKMLVSQQQFPTKIHLSKMYLCINRFKMVCIHSGILQSTSFRSGAYNDPSLAVCITK